MEQFPSVSGGGFVTQGPFVGDHRRLPKYELASQHLYNDQFNGKSYAVKYLGIVDGSMGILSRKMALSPDLKRMSPQ
jgi:hypothetical protein